MLELKDPTEGNELSHHFFSVHGGWYEDGVQFQLIKLVTQATTQEMFSTFPSLLQEGFPDITKALETQEFNMNMQLELFSPKGLNLRYAGVKFG